MNLKGNLEAAVKEEEKRRSKTTLIQNVIDGLKAKLEELGAKEDDSAELNRQLAQVMVFLHSVRSCVIKKDIL